MKLLKETKSEERFPILILVQLNRRVSIRRTFLAKSNLHYMVSHRYTDTPVSISFWF